MGMNLPFESSNAEMSMALPTAWALSLPIAAPLRLRHSYPGPVRTARRSVDIWPAINGATRWLIQAVSRSANWQETTGSSGRWTSVTTRARVVTDLRRTGTSIAQEALAATGIVGISNRMSAARRRARQASSSRAASSVLFGVQNWGIMHLTYQR